MSDHEVRVRAFDGQDWPEIWTIIRQVSAEGRTFTYPLDIREAQARSIWLEGIGSDVLVAVDRSGRVLGTAKIGPNQMGPGAHVSTASFMVDTRSRQQGVGRWLAEACVERARTRGFHSMQFNAVVSTNHPALALWKSLGFQIVGTVPDGFCLPDNSKCDLLIMHRDLQGS